MSECCKEARLISWIAEEMGRTVPWPLDVYVDNAAGVSYQHSTCALSKQRGVYDQRTDWVQELKDEKQINAVKIETARNLADLYTKCHMVATRKKLQAEMELLALETASK